MSKLLPILRAASIRRGLVVYLTTTFALVDPDMRDALDRFLSDPDTGMFKGPYVWLRLPFRPAADVRHDRYGLGEDPEAFRYPILDHVLRAARQCNRDEGADPRPMNALANDQAKRLTDLLTSHAELSVVTAALYAGEA